MSKKPDWANVMRRQGDAAAFTDRQLCDLSLVRCLQRSQHSLCKFGSCMGMRKHVAGGRGLSERTTGGSQVERLNRFLDEDLNARGIVGCTRTQNDLR